MNYYIGLDNGGTLTKAALYTSSGEEVAVCSAATEIAVPLAALQARPGDTLRFNATVRSGAVEDGFTAATDDPETWMRIELK